MSNRQHGEQAITFVKTLPESEPPEDGILCQEVIRALLHRIHWLDEQEPCEANAEIRRCLRRAFVLFEVRAFQRTLEKSYRKTGRLPEQMPVGNNGHVFDPEEAQ